MQPDYLTGLLGIHGDRVTAFERFTSKLGSSFVRISLERTREGHIAGATDKAFPKATVRWPSLTGKQSDRHDRCGDLKS